MIAFHANIEPSVENELAAAMAGLLRDQKIELG